MRFRHSNETRPRLRGARAAALLSVLVPVLVLMPVALVPAMARADLAKGWSLALQAVGQIVERKPAAAILTLKRLRSHQSSAEVEGLVGIAALTGGHADDGYRLLARAAGRGSLPLLQYWAGRAAYQAGNPSAARTHLVRAVAMGGNQPLFRVAQALVAKAMGRKKEALSSLVEAARSWSNLADPRLFPVPAEGAIELLSPLLRRFPRPFDLARTQGYLYWRLGRILPAQERFASIVRSRPADADALQMLAQCSYRLGHTQEALGLARKAMKAAPDLAAVRATYGELLLAAGDAGSARPELKQAADARPRDARLLALLARACSQTQDIDCAAKFFGYAARREPRSAAVQIGLATALQHNGDRDGAARAAAAAVALEPADPHVYEVAAHLARVRQDERLAKDLLVRARRTRRGYQAMQRTQRKMRRMVTFVVRASQACRCAPRCERLDRSCRAATSKLRGSNRRFMLAHQALQGKRLGRARSLLRPVLGVASPRRLLLGDPVRIAHVVSVAGHNKVALELPPMVSFDRVE